jgi:outer membrane lipoprotein-sorting protein
MKKVFTAILATILIAMTFTACTPETNETLTFYMPDGAPALAAAQAMADEDFKLDGHEVDFAQAMQRMKLYATEEGRLYLKAKEGDTHHCGCGNCAN